MVSIILNVGLMGAMLVVPYLVDYHMDRRLKHGNN